MKTKRILTWSELTPHLRAAALAKLGRLAEAKARYDGTLLGYAWPERIAPRLRYTLTARGVAIWDCDLTNADRACGYSLFTLPPLSLERIAA